MSSGSNSYIYRAAMEGGIESAGKRKKYSVILKGIRGRYEDSTSFAIKFSILAKIPLPRVKGMIRSLPVTVYTGNSRSRALYIMGLLNEAGGGALIAEDDPTEGTGDIKQEIEEERAEPDEDDGDSSVWLNGSAEKGKPRKINQKDRSITRNISQASIPTYRLVIYIIALILTLILGAASL